MTPSQIRSELLKDHERLRTMMDEARKLAARASSGEPVIDELRQTVAILADVLRAHNVREEELLGGFIRSVDAWGPVRAEIMTEEHAQEHEEFFAALLGVQTTPVEFAGAGVMLLLDRILEHMACEEAVFLSEDVLRDDLAAIDYFGG